MTNPAVLAEDHSTNNRLGGLNIAEDAKKPQGEGETRAPPSRLWALRPGERDITAVPVLSHLMTFLEALTMPNEFNDPAADFLAFIKQQGKSLHGGMPDVTTREEWQTRREIVRRRLIKSWGGFPRDPCPLAPRVVGELQRDGYRVEKLLLQTRPGVLMTANVYVPEQKGKRPAVLCVHGHWKQAKSEKVVQSRCIGLVKQGYVVLMVDAFGAGERGIGKALGEYHGEMVAGTLWPTGVALAGLQVYENMRAVDYLTSRPEVDADRIGVTGCSGGGNQTMYVGAIDERLKVVVPVCSVGTYQAYLGAACCMCEVTPAAITYAKESDVLSLVAPRALMVINATKDAFQFSVGEAKKSVAGAQLNFQWFGKQEDLKHVVVDAGHGYNQEMREAMYGWMALHLMEEGDGSPIAEPKIETEDAETLRCYSNDSRPDDFVTVPKFAAMTGREILARRRIPSHAEQWDAEMTLMRESLPRVMGAFPKQLAASASAGVAKQDRSGDFELESEPGVKIRGAKAASNKASAAKGTVVILDLDQGRKAAESAPSKALLTAGWDVVAVELRATGDSAPKNDKIGRADDHNSAEWSMWVGRPLLGQWVGDVRRLIDTLEEGGAGKSVAVLGVGPASVVALCAAAIDRRIQRVGSIDGLATYVTDAPYENQRLGIMAPGILRGVGDIPQLAALTSPRRLVVGNPTDPLGVPLSKEEMWDQFKWTQAAYQHHGAAQQLHLVASTDPDESMAAVVAALAE